MPTLMWAPDHTLPLWSDARITDGNVHYHEDNTTESFQPIPQWMDILASTSKKEVTVSRKKNKQRRTNRHHRLSRSRTNGEPFDGNIYGIPNVIVVDYKHHQSFHNLFTDTHPEAVARVLNEQWIDPHYVILAVPRKEARKMKKYLSQFV